MSVKAYLMSRPTPSLRVDQRSTTRSVTPGPIVAAASRACCSGQRIEVLPAAAERGKLTELRDGGLGEEQPLIDGPAAVGLERQHGRELKAGAAHDGAGQNQGEADISHTAQRCHRNVAI